MREVGTSIAQRVEAVRERIAGAAERAGRNPSEVTLIAVSKTRRVEQIIEAARAGVTDFGENRVQEAEAKFSPPGVASPGLVSHESITLHMIGSLQRNKARDAVRLFDRVHSVDRAELAEALERAVAQDMPARILPVLLEVNYTGEATKSGVAPVELTGLVEVLARCEHLKCTGLMTIARLGDGQDELRKTFSGLRGLLEGFRADYPDMQHLSMGMTDDFEIAVEEGATMVRIGRAIFGERGQ